MIQPLIFNLKCKKNNKVMKAIFPCACLPSHIIDTAWKAKEIDGCGIVQMFDVFPDVSLDGKILCDGEICPFDNGVDSMFLTIFYPEMKCEMTVYMENNEDYEGDIILPVLASHFRLQCPPIPLIDKNGEIQNKGKLSLPDNLNVWIDENGEIGHS